MRVILLGWCAVLFAHDPITTRITYSREIIRIFEKRCITCHKDGGKAPMSLAKYDEARPWAKAIKEEVLERRMPPWGAVKGFGSFQHEMGLSQEEISVIADWVEGGAPEGDAKHYPEKLSSPPPPVTKLKGIPLKLNATLVIAKPVLLTGIEPRAKSDIDSLRVIAEQPDGSVEPLLWLKNYKAVWRRQFEFRQPVALAAGSKLRVQPSGQAMLLVYTRSQ